MTEPQPASAQSVEERAAQFPQVKNGEYWIVGVKATHVIEKGDDLSKLALEHYGNKRMISYIIKLNRLRDPSHVCVGQEIKLPELASRQ